MSGAKRWRSPAHTLIVHDEVTGGMEVEHPLSCPPGCAVSRELSFRGLAGVAHRDDPGHSGEMVRLVPGRYVLTAWSETIPSPFVEYETNSGLEVCRESGGLICFC